MEGENSKRLKTNANASNDRVDTFRTLFSVVDSNKSSGSGTNWETNREASGCGSAKIPDSSDAMSSSCSSSSSGELFQVNPQVLPKSKAPNDTPQPNEGTEQLYKNSKIYVSSESWRRLQESNSDSPESVSKFSDITHESFVPHILPTQSPPIQVMERTVSFDPNKIPSSIFSTSSTPSEWSIASNESLFSIHIGNDSFSRDHALRMSGHIYLSGEIPKSGELLKSRELYLSREFYLSGELHQSGELCKSDDLKRSAELINLMETSPAAKGVEPNENADTSKNTSQDMKPGAAKAVTDKPISDVPGDCINVHSDIYLGESSHPYSANPHSAGNEITLQLFTSSIKKKPACPLCCCSKSLSCCCKLSDCSYKWFSWPSCYSCKCPSCHFKCLTCSSCCCKSPSWPSSGWEGDNSVTK